MLEKDVLLKLLTTMTEDIESNKKKMKIHFGNVKLISSNNQTLLHIFCDDKYDEKQCFLAIKTLLEMDVNPNQQDRFKYNFIQTALYTGYSEKFILKIVEEAFKHGLNPNQQDDDKDTVIHTAIYSEDYYDGIEELLKLYISHGFDITIKCRFNNDIIEAMPYQNKYLKDRGIKSRTYTESEINKIKKICTEHHQDKNLSDSRGNNKNKITPDNKLYLREEIKEDKIDENKNIQQPVKMMEIDPSLIEELEKYGEVLNVKKYASCPTIGREDEVMRLMVSLAGDETSPMLIGESGVGKTAIADELAYRITYGIVPKFLKNKIILEINAETIAEGCVYVGQFEEKISNLMKLVKANDVILLINEIHTIHGPGSTSKKDNDFASIIKKQIDRSGLKVVGTTTKSEYTTYFSQNAIKRRFETIVVEEPNDDLLYTILEKIIIDYTVKKSIPVKDENTMYKIIESLIEVTNKKNRKYDDKLCNPALAKSIIDKAFAYALVFEDEYIEEHHFIKAIEWCERIYPTSKEKVINKLNSKKENNQNKPAILQFRR